MISGFDLTSYTLYLNPLDDDSTPPPPDVAPSEFVISVADVERKLSQIHVHKTPGPDGLPNWLL